ncbi:MAG: DUF21 domain-containing protein, partial [Pirellulales bacterium]|nr:DUF21 domain-containing protein [Pirellulales bacterium]
VLFVYGELLPKKVFLQAPNRLLRLGGPLFAIFFVLFSPVSLLLWGLNGVLAWLTGQSPQRVRVTLARRELQKVLEEGHDVGLLRASQQSLARGIFALANRPVTAVATPLSDVPKARSDMTKEDVLQLAQRYRVAEIPVESADASGNLIGYYRVVDMGLAGPGSLGPLHTLLAIPQTENHVSALVLMENAGETLAQIVDTDDRPVALLTASRLREPLFRGS